MSRRPLRRLTLPLAPLVLAACWGSPPAPPAAPDPVPPPDPLEVEAVLFLVGDAGDATSDNSPTLLRLQQDVEAWAARLPPGAEVAVLVLGDIVYPVGVHPADDPTYHRDTAVVMAQVRVVLGPAALERGVPMYFLAGNHDWGLRRHFEGFVRLRNLDELLASVRAGTGARVLLTPEAGTGGPQVVDLGRHLRLLLLDTAWWLLAGNDPEKEAVMRGVEEAMRTAGTREVVLAAHHPFRSVGPHGGFFDFWETFGARYLLVRSGAILQDLTSVPYRGLERGLREIFRRRGAPLVFAGGHEHSLQVMEAVRADDPRFTLVSGSASKLTRVGHDVGVRYAASEPGYMRLVVERGGGITLFVEATGPEYLKCRGADEVRRQCLLEGLTAFRTTYAQRLR